MVGRKLSRRGRRAARLEVRPSLNRARNPQSFLFVFERACSCGRSAVAFAPARVKSLNHEGHEGARRKARTGTGTNSRANTRSLDCASIPLREIDTPLGDDNVGTIATPLR